MSDLCVAFDREIFVRQSGGGVSRYFANLIREFHARPELGMTTRLLFSRNSNLHLQTAAPELVSDMPPLRYAPRGVPRMLNQVAPLKDAFLQYRAGSVPDGGHVDWLHATGFRPMSADVRRGQRLACTVHDMIPEILGLPTDRGPHQGKLALARNSDLILVVSHATANQVEQLAPELADRLVVVPLGVQAEQFSSPAPGPMGVDFPYVLFLGARTGYKRFDLAVDAIKRARDCGIDIGLLVAGAACNTEDALRLKALPSERVRFMSPSDFELPGLYQHACALVLTSDIEGFGLPMLEAFASGCPVVASDIPAFREVGQDVPQYFAKGHAEDLAIQLQQVIGNDPEPMRAAGRSRAAEMSWASTAEATAHAYRMFL